MTTNKTPIQELVDWILECENSIFAISATEIELKMLSQFKDKLKSQLQKEKAFAFDCYETGVDYACGSYEDFDQFYSQYAAQHTE